MCKICAVHVECIMSLLNVDNLLLHNKPQTSYIKNTTCHHRQAPAMATCLQVDSSRTRPRLEQRLRLHPRLNHLVYLIPCESDHDVLEIEEAMNDSGWYGKSYHQLLSFTQWFTQ